MSGENRSAGPDIPGLVILGDRIMNARLAVPIAAVFLAAASVHTASAAYCGAASYSHCCDAGTVNGSESDCGAAVGGAVADGNCGSHVVMRTVREVVYEPKQMTCYRNCYETVYEDRTVSCVNYVTETAYRNVEYTVRKPVYETRQKTYTYCVNRPVWETKTRTVNYTVMKPVWETKTRT
jgi:hypothetical protein